MPTSIHQDDPPKQSLLPRASTFFTKTLTLVRPLGEGGNSTTRPVSTRETDRRTCETFSPTSEPQLQEYWELSTTPPVSGSDCAILDYDDENATTNSNGFFKPEKRKPRPSLSERTIETLASITSSPSTTRRRSSTARSRDFIVQPASPTRNHRSETQPKTSSRRPPSPIKKPFRPTGNSVTLAKEAVPLNIFGPIYTPPRALLRDQNSRIGKPLRDTRRSASTAITADQNDKPVQVHKSSHKAVKVKSMYDLRAAASRTLKSKPSLPSLAKSLATLNHESNVVSEPSLEYTPSQISLLKARQQGEDTLASSTTNPAEAPLKSLRSTKHNKRALIPNQTRKRETPVDTTTENVDKSSTTLRDTIAKAKVARREDFQESTTTTTNTSGQPLHDEISSPEPLITFGSQSLQKKIDGALTSGVLNLSALNLKSIPQEVLTMYDFKEHSAVSWAETVDLKKLIMADNELEELSGAAFPDWSREQLFADPEKTNHFGGLEVLDLHGNNLKGLPVGFRRLEQLSILNLSSNSFDTSIFAIINQLSNLRELRLTKSALSGSIPPELASMKSLQVLDLRDNKLDRLPSNLHELQNLQKLLLGGNQISSVAISSVPSQNLIELDLSRNLLTNTFITATTDGASFQKLQVLDLSHNALECLCSESLELRSLQNLAVHNNRLKSLPNLFSCTELTTLTASANLLTAIPTGFYDLIHLRNVDFSGNSIKSLESQILKMKTLIAFNITSNPLREKRYLTMNIDEIKVDLVKRATPVEIVVPDTEAIHESGGKNIPDENAVDSIFRPKAGVLDLSSQGLSSLDPSQVDLTTPIHTIRLANNDFTTFPTSLLLHPSIKWSLKSLNLSHNPNLHPVAYLDTPIELPLLQSLYIVSTGLTTLDTLTSHLKAPELKELNISCHRMAGHIPWVRAWYPCLTTLLASDNWFESIDVEAVRGLEVLDVRNNEIETLPAKIGLLGNHANRQNEPGRLRSFECSGNRFRVPRILVVEKGTEAILKDLRRIVPVCDVPEEWAGEI